MWIFRKFKSNQYMWTKWIYILSIIVALSIFIHILILKPEQIETISFSPHMRHYTEVMNGYLVSSSECRMASINPMHSNILQYVKKFDIKSCSAIPLLSSIVTETDGNVFLVINNTAAKYYENFTCCWKSIIRPKLTRPLTPDWDSIIDEGVCEDFGEKVVLPWNLEIVMVSCRANHHTKEKKAKILYKNIHAIVNPAKVLKDRNTSLPINNKLHHNRRKMSILILGIDSVSRLNFLRSLPRTEKHLRETGWFSLNGYNKIGDNTYPNLMALLTGQNESTADSTCKPKQAYGLDMCPLLWHGYKEAGYVTAYGEDWVSSATFNLLKVGFVNPPTDYYLRPYVVATEKLLEAKYKIGSIPYCSGPEPTVKRIYNYASNFAKTFLDVPYFGFFWTNSVSHDDLNGISLMDNYFLDYFKNLEKDGVFNNTMVIFLSDHGMRFGEFRKTFVGWYEERLPFVYLRVPKGYNQSSEISEALKINEHRLTSPYDIYETLRDILMQSGGTISPSSGCSTCQTLLRPVPKERSCKDAGISPHWCTCAITEPTNQVIDETIANKSVETFLHYVENIIMNYRDENYQRMCAQLQLKKIHYMNQIVEINDGVQVTTNKYSFRIEVMPGNGMFEFVIYANQNSSFTVLPEEISRINSYAKDAKCLDNSYKKYCYCVQ